MELRDHVHLTGNALKNWFIAMAQDAAAVGALWLVGLLILRIPWAPYWALLAAALQFIPHLGPVLALIGPLVTALLVGEDLYLVAWVLMLYAIIVVVDALLLQPYFMRRTARVPVWASLAAPFLIAIFIGFWWAALIAAPLLAVLFAYRHRRAEQRRMASPAAPGSAVEPRKPPVIEMPRPPREGAE